MTESSSAPPAAPVETSFDLPNGMRIAGLRAGATGSPGLLALHGWLDNAASFEPLLPWLSRRYDAVAVDLPGHGRSDHRAPTATYEYVQWLDDVDAILHALGWSRVTLLGHSLGAGIALMYAGLCPDRVERVVAIEGLGPLTNAPADAPGVLVEALRDRRRPVRAARALPDLDAAVSRMSRARPPTSPQALGRLAARGTRPVADGVVFSHDPRLQGRSLLRLTEPHVQAVLGRITAPVTLVRATEGGELPAPVVQSRIAAITAPLNHAVLRGGHHAHLDDPAAAIDVLSGVF